MLNLTYLAVLEPGEDGSYSVSFPDLPGCFSYGDNLTEAQRMAEEAASLHHPSGMAQTDRRRSESQLFPPFGDCPDRLPAASKTE